MVHLQVDGLLQRRPHVFRPVGHDALGAHGLRDAGKARALQIARHEAATVEVHLVLLLGPPLPVVEHHRCDRNVVAHAGENLAKAHPPGTIAHIGHGRPVRGRHLGTDDGGKGIAAVAEAHRRKEAAGPFEAQVTVRHRVDVADVGGHHHVRRQCPLQLAQRLTRMQVLAATEGSLALLLANHVEAVGVGLVHPGIQLLLPGRLFGADFLCAFGLRGITGQGAALQTVEQRQCCLLRVAADTHRDLLHQPQHPVIGIHLDDLCILRPVVHAVLRQRAERPQPRAQRQHHVGLGNQLHARLRTLIAQRPAPQRVTGRKAVVVLVAVDHGGAQPLGQRPAGVHPIGHHHPAPGDDHRKRRVRQQIGGTVETFAAAGTALHPDGLRDFGLDVTVEIIARDIELRGPQLRQRTVEGARRVLGHARRVVDVGLISGEFLEHGQLVAFLKAAQPHGARTGLGCDDHHRAVRPVSRCNGRDTVADARTILADHHPLPSAGAGITIGHVAGPLFVHRGNETDARRRENVHRIHEG